MIQRLTVLLIVISFFACKQKPKVPEKKPVVLLKGDFAFRKLAETEKSTYDSGIQSIYNKILGKHFNGGVIVAKNGEIVFERYNGFSNFSTQESITSSTPLHVASISKTFTSAAILKLWEQQKLSLDDSLQQYFPNFPYHNISIKLLLTHRSGLPKYEYFMDTAWHENRQASNNDMLQFMISKQPDMYAKPNRHYQYCNTNFALLALIVEKITGQPFPQYMKDSLFLPLGMNNSFVFGTQDTLNYVPSYVGNTPYKLEPLDCIYGDKNVYSTPRDLLLWDKALYGGAFISKQTLQMAFEPYSSERRSVHNYGMGWHLFIGKEKEDKVVYHNGWWHGNNASFVRLVKDTATVITLGNRYNRAVYWSGRMGSVFSKGKEKDRKLEE